MKTVVDAVNELRAEAASGKHTTLVGTTPYGHLGFDGDGDWISCSPYYGGKVCSLEEFNQCVAEMSEAKWIPEKVNKMKTVSDFKSAGLVFVRGDHTIEIDGSSSKDDVNFSVDLNATNVYNGSAILEFAWRENTGEKPSFNGLVDVITKIDAYNGASEYEVKKSSDVDWRIHCCSHQVVKWRPSLNKPEQNTQNSETAKPNDKPVFTQEMADAGELPHVGSKLTLFKKTYSKRTNEFLNEELTIIGVTKSADGSCVITWEHEHLGLCCGVYLTDYFKPIDTRTPKQKAVDDALKSIGYGGNVVINIVSELYDKGYLKPK